MTSNVAAGAWSCEVRTGHWFWMTVSRLSISVLKQCTGVSSSSPTPRVLHSGLAERRAGVAGPDVVLPPDVRERSRAPGLDHVPSDLPRQYGQDDVRTVPDPRCGDAPGAASDSQPGSCGTSATSHSGRHPDFTSTSLQTTRPSGPRNMDPGPKLPGIDRSHRASASARGVVRRPGQIFRCGAAGTPSSVGRQSVKLHRILGQVPSDAAGFSVKHQVLRAAVLALPQVAPDRSNFPGRFPANRSARH